MANLVDILAGQVIVSGNALAVRHDNEPAGFANFIAAHNMAIFARQAGHGVAPFAWLEDVTRYQQIFLPLPKGRDALELYAANMASHLDGTLYVFGLNDDGIKSADKTLAKYFSSVETIATGGHGRLIAAKELIEKYRLDDFKQSMMLNINGSLVEYVTYPSLFAKSKLDEATALLIDHLPQTQGAIDVLDYACGLGTLARAVQLENAAARFMLADYDALAIYAAQENVSGAQTICTASPAQVTGQYDLIVSNPPIHEGQALSYRIVGELVAQFKRLLKPGGAAYIVAQVTVPVGRIAAESKLAATEVAASRSFRITKITA